MQKDLTNLLTKEMDRRDFLKHVAIGMVAMTGLGALVRTLNDVGSKKQSVGYGASAYGGGRTPRG